MLIQTEKSIAIAHFVQTADEESPCRRLHGHNLKVVVTVNGRVKNDGMVVDFRHIKEIINQLDHKTIVPGSLIVSEEDGLLYISTGYSKLALPINDMKVLSLHYVSVQIFESDKSFAEADEDDDI
jgi:6-pyruvoyltetrahydropterin/6-carboxytetrahydropterin synthase